MTELLGRGSPVADVLRIHSDKSSANFRALKGRDLNWLILPKNAPARDSDPMGSPNPDLRCRLIVRILRSVMDAKAVASTPNCQAIIETADCGEADRASTD